jgi:hypothetical protein
MTARAPPRYSRALSLRSSLEMSLEIRHLWEKTSELLFLEVDNPYTGMMFYCTGMVDYSTNKYELICPWLVRRASSTRLKYMALYRALDWRREEEKISRGYIVRSVTQYGLCEYVTAWTTTMTILFPTYLVISLKVSFIVTCLFTASYESSRWHRLLTRT